VKKLTVIFLVLGGVLIGVGFGFLLGWKQGAFQLALQENKIATANLSLHSTNLTPQLREYLKARVYCNVCTYYPRKAGYLVQKDWDYGKVDRDTLGKVAVFKDPHQIAWDWESAITNK
jgi:hypothetical protein